MALTRRSMSESSAVRSTGELEDDAVARGGCELWLQMRMAPLHDTCRRVTRICDYSPYLFLPHHHPLCSPTPSHTTLTPLTLPSDFFNLLEGGEAPPIVVKSMSETSITLTDGLVISQPVIFLNGSVLLWDAPSLDVKQASPGGHGWEAWGVKEWRVFEVVDPKPGELRRGVCACERLD